MALEQIRAKSTKKSLSGRERQCERGAADLPETHKTSHRAIINWPHLTGINPEPLITAEKMIIVLQEAVFATCMDWMGKKEHGTIFNLDVLIAAFQFGNEHDVKSDSQRDALAD